VKPFAAVLLALLAAALFAQSSAERIPKVGTDAERMNDNVIARREYDSNARAILSRKLRDALDRYQRGPTPELIPTWGEFVAVDGQTFIALQLALPAGLPVQSGDPLTLFGLLNDANGKTIATYNESLGIQASKDDFFVERSLVVPLQKSIGTFGIARRGEILGMTRVEFDPENVTAAAAGVSRLIVSRDVHLLPEAQRPLDPFAFGGTKVIPKPGASFRKTDEVWLFAELRNPSLAPDGTPHISTKVTLEGAANISGPPVPAEATPLKGMPGRYGVGNPIDISRLPAGDYTLHVVFTDLVAKQSFQRQASIHILD
jgi:hypothetical protein